MISTTVRPEEGSSQADMRNVGQYLRPMNPIDPPAQPKILVTSPIDPTANELLLDLFPMVTAPRDDLETLLELLPGTRVLISRDLAPIDEQIMDAAPELAAICKTGAGYENINIKAATGSGNSGHLRAAAGPGCGRGDFHHDPGPGQAALLLALIPHRGALGSSGAGTNRRSGG